MGLFDQFPYTNFHELNLDWILNALRELEHTIDQFVSINALKYADPIQWNITRQYEKNTIVIDPLTGTAYISVQPVPSGVALTRDEYWTVVFDLGSFVVRAAKNFTDRWESQWTLTATFPSTAGDWLVWNDTLYKVISNIVAGDQYVIDSNIRHFTIEDIIGHPEDLDTTDKSNLVAAINEVLDTLVNTAGVLTDLDTTDKSNLVAAINEVLNTVVTIAGDLNDLNTTDKTNLVAAINEVLTTLGNIAGDLGDLNTTDKTNLVAAINEVLGNIGDLSDLDTTDKTNVVAAINENVGDIKIIQKANNVLHYGADPTGVNDSAAAFQAACDHGEFVYIPAGRYKINSTINLAFTNKVFGDGVNTTMIEFDAALPYLFNCAGRHTFNNFTVISNAGDNYVFYNNDHTGLTFNNVWLTGGSFSLTELKTKYLYCVGSNWENIVVENVLCDCGIYDNGFAFYLVSDGSHESNDLVFQNCFIDTVMATGNVNVGAVYMEKCRNAHINNSLIRSGNTVNGTASRAVACVDTTAIISTSSIRNGCTLIDEDSELENESSHIHQLVQLGYYIYYDNDIYQAIYTPLKHNRYNSNGGGSISRLYNGRVVIETDAGTVGNHNLIGLYYPYDADHTVHTFDVTLPKVTPFGSSVFIGVTDGTGCWGFAVASDYTNLDFELQLNRYANGTTQSASTRIANWTGERFIMRMEVSGSDVIFKVSPDATNWFDFRTVPISSMIDISTVTGFLIGVDNYVSNGTPVKEMAVINQSR